MTSCMGRRIKSEETVNVNIHQSRCWCCCCWCCQVPYESRLWQMELPSLVYRRYRGDMIEVFKYLHGMYSVSSSELLPRAPVSALRGHEYKLLKRHCRSHVRLTFFSCRVVTLLGFEQYRYWVIGYWAILACIG